MKKAKANSGKAGWMMRLTGFSYVGRIENLRDLVYYKLYGKDNFWFPFEVWDMWHRIYSLLQSMLESKCMCLIILEITKQQMKYLVATK